MAPNGKIKDSELEVLVDVFEGSYMLEQPRPETVGIEGGYIQVRYDRVRRIAPLNHPDFFTSFAKLAAHEDPSEAKIKRWVGRFGLPLRNKRPEHEVVEPQHEKPELKSLYRLNYRPMAMKVESFRSEALYAHDLLHLYSLIRGRNVPAIKDRVRWIDQNPDSASELDSVFREQYQRNTESLLTRAGDKRLGSYRKPLPASNSDSKAAAKMASYLAFPVNGEISETMLSHLEFVSMVTVLAAQSALGEILTDLIAGVRLRVGIQRGQGLAPSYECPDLASALYLQLYLLVTKNKGPRFCENPACGELFFPARGNQRHCSASCRSNARHYPKA